MVVFYITMYNGFNNTALSCYFDSYLRCVDRLKYGKIAAVTATALM